MHYKDESQLRKGLAEQAILLYGSESYLVELWQKKIAARFSTGGFGSFNSQRFDGSRLDLDELWEATQALPLMAAEKCVVVDNLDTKKLSADQLTKLAEIAGDLPEGCTLLVTAKPPEFDPRSAQGKKLVALFDKAGCAVELGSRDLTAFIKSVAKSCGCVASTDVCRYIIQLCENDMMSLRREVEKLCAYAGGGELTREQVDCAVIPGVEARVFDLGKAVLAGNAQRAMELLDALFYLREPAISILATLTMSFTDLYRARVARDSGMSQAEVVELFSYKGREFRVRNAFSQCGTLRTENLRRAMCLLFDCDRRLKSTGIDDRVLLEQTVMALFPLTAHGA